MITKYKLEKRIFAAVNNNMINKSIEIFFAEFMLQTKIHAWIAKVTENGKVIYFHPNFLVLKAKKIYCYHSKFTELISFRLPEISSCIKMNKI